MMDLVAKNEAFYFQDYERFGETYRVFNYRLASYTYFLEPYAKEMRGITRLLQGGKDPVIVSRPFEKFFNWEENPFTTRLDLSLATAYEEKADGSLIASYYSHKARTLGLKSKQAFFSEQAMMAEEWINKPENSEFKKRVENLAASDYTVLMELCSPANRIVLEYPTTHLKVHGIRSNITGEYVSKSSLDPLGSLYKAWVDQVEVEGLPESFIVSTVALKGLEGYVVHGPWGRFKLKTDWYCNLHHLKDSISTTKRLIEAILYERIDDVKALFKTDSFTLNRISETENLVVPKFNHIVKTVEDFYITNKDLNRKDFAIKGQLEIKDYFHLVMNRYQGKDVDYKGYCMKYLNEVFGVKDTSEENNE